ncbi:MAG: 50S ribosomal protein L5 [Desulfomonilaceae bacterium]|jgi:large subunit ribosomal protein L5|nr:50S ribosomal protein L5 [Syntrophaceae bacterium]
MASRLREYYLKSVVPALREQYKYKNSMQVPVLKKIVINMGLGEAILNAKALESAQQELSLISGQWPVMRKARKSIASFKLREGMTIGCKVTLRRDNMFHFLDKLINVALPRVRDFRGINPKGFDGRGNFSMGIKEQIIFPEINYDRLEKIRGMNITLVTSAKTDEEAKQLLDHLGMPFRK